jgi:hypothetical protein
MAHDRRLARLRRVDVLDARALDELPRDRARAWSRPAGREGDHERKSPHGARGSDGVNERSMPQADCQPMPSSHTRSGNSSCTAAQFQPHATSNNCEEQMKKTLSKDIIAQINSKMDELEGKEAEQGLAHSRGLSDQELAGVSGGALTAAWSIEIGKGGHI